MKSTLKTLLILFITATSGHASSRFGFVLKEIIKFQEFRTEFHESLQQKMNESLQTIHNLNQEDYARLERANRQTIEKGNEFIQQLYERAINLSESDKAVSLLEYLLVARFDTIYETARMAESCSSSAIGLPVQDSSLADKYYNIEKLVPQDRQEFYKFIRENNIYLYQFEVLLIKKIFQALSLEELNPAVIKLLRASPALADILSNKSTKLGCVDDCGGYLKCMVYSNDFDFDETRVIAAIATGKKSRTWEKIKKSYDIYWYESHFIKKERIMPFLGLGMPKDHGLRSSLTDYENGDAEDLPMPDYLLPRERPFIEYESFFNTVEFSAFEDVAEAEPNPNDHNTALPQDVCKKAPSASLETAQQTKEFIYPSGLRKFHNLMPDSPYEERILKPSQQKFINRIFDPKAFSKISFGNFRKFWLKIGGQVIEDRGSAHKQLIGPNNDALVGVSAHSDAQTYGKNTIKYFRAALYYIGCRPE